MRYIRKRTPYTWGQIDDIIAHQDRLHPVYFRISEDAQDFLLKFSSKVVLDVFPTTMMVLVDGTTYGLKSEGLESLFLIPELWLV